MIRKIAKVDIDRKPLDVRDFVWRLVMVEEILGCKIGRIGILETAKGYHVYVEVIGELDNKDLIIVQLALGSDYIRELYNLRRVKNCVRNWNVLFTAKYKEEGGKLVKISEEIPAMELAYKVVTEYMHLKQCKENHKEAVRDGCNLEVGEDADMPRDKEDEKKD